MFGDDSCARSISGVIALSCEHAADRPCNGVGGLAEFDGSAGYADYISGSLRLRASGGSEGYYRTLALDRLYANISYGPVEFEVGRDVLILGPRSRTQLGWGDHAPALDHLRLSTSEPLRLHDKLRGNALYAVARLRDPQTFPGSLLTVARVQLDVADCLEMGLQQLLTLGGE